eukprot:TRINITY_DN10373_c0_g1_i4.p1 TRINITY_DN10373_c0_g1~~TRINITY_DN10373_c0_g1_i4.p1  ORF type:complete len:267 (+),score=60.78 TRINITY_DN10373_c0_g1_i4:595-1395(+)
MKGTKKEKEKKKKKKKKRKKRRKTMDPARFERLRKEARKLEADIDNELSVYGKLGSKRKFMTRDVDIEKGDAVEGGERESLLGSHYRECDGSAEKLTQLLTDLGDLVESMEGCAGTGGPIMHALQRHKEILHDYTQEFRRYQANIAAEREHADLISSVRKDISKYRESAGIDSRTDHLLRERNAIHETDRMLTDVIGQAITARDTLGDQRKVFEGAHGKATGIAASFPFINNLIGKIKTKKRRDMIILSIVIAVCLMITILWYLNR